ncbi:MAG: biotin/lipoyl-containing protein, partial [Flavobacteriales bacterium]
MAEIQIILPKMGESVAEATITTWLKSEGDSIELDESIVEIATDKVDSEVPSPGDGILSKILVNEGEIAQVGQAIAIISMVGSDASTT